MASAMMMADPVAPKPRPTTTNQPDEEDFTGFCTQVLRKEADEAFDSAVISQEMDEPFFTTAQAASKQPTRDEQFDSVDRIISNR